WWVGGVGGGAPPFLLGGGGEGGARPLGAVLGCLAGGSAAKGRRACAGGLGWVEHKGGGATGARAGSSSGQAERQGSRGDERGATVAVRGEQVQGVFGGAALNNMASQFGLQGDQASSVIAQILPEVVNHLTPQGSVPENHADLISEVLSMLRR